MSFRARMPLASHWPAALVAASLVAPIFINTIAHPEIFTVMIVTGLLGVSALLLVRREFRLSGSALNLSLAVFLAYLGVRSAFAQQPVVSLYGAYSLDGTFLAFLAIAVALVRPAATGGTLKRDAGSFSPFISLCAVIVAYCVVSGIAAWQWGSTDGVGGPPSGFTANSQYHLQLLTVGLTCAVAWAVARRRSTLDLLLSLAAAAFILVTLQQARSSVTIPALTAGALFAASLRFAPRRIGPSVFAAAWTGLIGLIGLGSLIAFLVPRFSVTAVPVLDRLGSGRGALWNSAARIWLENPLFGRGLAHATSVTRWRLEQGSFDLTTTTDPHNLFYLLASGGGLVGLGLGIAVVYFLLRALRMRADEATAEERLHIAILSGGGAALFALGHFAFSYPVAWTLMALLLGFVLAPGASERATVGPPRWSIALGLILVAAVTVGVLSPTTTRAESLMLSYRGNWSSPGQLIDAQIALVRHPSDVMPAETAFELLSPWLDSDPAAASAYLPAVNAVQDKVSGSFAWDARLASSAMQLWRSADRTGGAEPDELVRTLDAAILADPASGLWATAGSVLLEDSDPAQAIRYAKMVRSDPAWWSQLTANGDRGTRELVEELSRR